MTSNGHPFEAATVLEREIQVEEDATVMRLNSAGAVASPAFARLSPDRRSRPSIERSQA